MAVRQSHASAAVDSDRCACCPACAWDVGSLHSVSEDGWADDRAARLRPACRYDAKACIYSNLLLSTDARLVFFATGPGRGKHSERPTSEPLYRSTTQMLFHAVRTADGKKEWTYGCVSARSLAA